MKKKNVSNKEKRTAVNIRSDGYDLLTEIAVECGFSQHLVIVAALLNFKTLDEDEQNAMFLDAMRTHKKRGGATK